MLYFVSPYYKRLLYTGANKRFDEIGKKMLALLGDNFRIIICDGEKPDWAPYDRCLFIPYYRNHWQRLHSYNELRKLLSQLEPATVVSDFMPIPLSALRRHRHFQLIHDLRNFTAFKRGGLSILTAQFQKMQLTRSQYIVTVSECTKGDLIERCGIPAENIIVSYDGIDEQYIQPSASTEKDIDILYVATFEERKNHRRLMQALTRSNSGLKIRFIGQDLGTRNEITKLADELTREKGHKFEFTSSVEEDALIDSYRRAKVYTFPSLLEGFGMPLIEALACNCNVVCSDLPVFHEICGDYANYFDGRDPSSIWESVNKALVQTDARDSSEYVKRFLWRNIADNLVQDLDCTSLRCASAA